MQTKSLISILIRCRNLNLAVQKFRFYTDFLPHYQCFLNNNDIHPIGHVAWAVENGITTGFADGTFHPNATCTRWAVVLFMYRDMA